MGYLSPRFLVVVKRSSTGPDVMKTFPIVKKKDLAAYSA